MNKYVYSFNEGSKEMKSLLGGKGANLAEMTKIGLPVPFGFTISTDACNKYYQDGETISQDIIDEIFEKMQELEAVTDKQFGSNQKPLLVSVRSGAVFSMPGMMDTVLNLGLNDDTINGLIAITGNERFAYDSYRRFIQMFADVVIGIEKEKFDKIFDGKKEERGCKLDLDLTCEDLKEITKEYKKLYLSETGNEFPQDPKIQLIETVKAVFRSWNNDRAVLYRKLNDISSNLGTAVNVQSMVFGNTGENKLYGEFLINAQGEDVVAGIRTPQPISEMAEAFPEIYNNFKRIAELLEKHYKDMQDMEFTIENNKLYMLQTRNGKRTAQAAVKIAVDMEEEGLIDKQTAIMRIEPEQIDQLLHPRFDDDALEFAKKLTKGLPASPGAATGKIYFTTSDVETASLSEKVILVRQETSPEDLAGMVAAEGILTSRGGMTSHAAVVARGMGKCCVAGCKDAIVDEFSKTVTIGDIVLKEGDYISLDGSTGMVYEGKLKSVEPELSGSFDTLMKWTDEIRTLKIRTNADNPKDAAKAIEFGAEGIGLCRTEHMFFDEQRIMDVRRMILSSDETSRRKALSRLLPYQKDDFKGIFKVMGERPVTIRLLDPPLHEFLPNTDEEIKALSEEINVSFDILKNKVIELKEFNPMLGHRGCRLVITYPEIAQMQAEAIISAAIEVKNETKLNIIPEIMIPLVGIDKELTNIKNTVVETIDKTLQKYEETIEYQIGTMIEIPRAALVADKIAEEAEFFSFGTNDLTQMTFGFSRDDTGKIIREYVDKGILEKDPFQTIDQEGIGKLIKMAIELGKKTRPNIKLGICGEHGGDPKSIEYCNNIGLNYVSCSPFRVPIARIAAAQAVIRTKIEN